MVTTASASPTASATDPAGRHPAAFARSSASAERSKARTSCPAFARLAAMPEPIWPSPMMAMVVMRWLRCGWWIWRKTAEGHKRSHHTRAGATFGTRPPCPDVRSTGGKVDRNTTALWHRSGEKGSQNTPTRF